MVVRPLIYWSMMWLCGHLSIVGVTLILWEMVAFVVGARRWLHNQIYHLLWEEWLHKHPSAVSAATPSIVAERGCAHPICCERPQLPLFVVARGSHANPKQFLLRMACKAFPPNATNENEWMHDLYMLCVAWPFLLKKTRPCIVRN